jgi:beta-lactamase regulating signal transducer with metallopeptidase domain
MLTWFGETTVVVAALCALAATIGRLGRLGPAARHALWLVVLLKLVTPPVVRSPWADSFWATQGRLSQHFARAEPETASEPATEATDDAEMSLVIEAEIPDLAWVDDETEPTVGPQQADLDASRPATRRLAGLKWPRLVIPRWLGPASIGVWAVGAATIGAWQMARVVRFRRRLESSPPAPEWLTGQVEWLAEAFGVRPPRTRLVPGIASPMLWCLGRPQLLIPTSLVDELPPERWRCVLAHELAHLRRGDPWVSRLELVAGLIWWWNPLYWLIRSRLDVEAELACDAWVVWAMPKGRRDYAEALLDVCQSLFPAKAPAPALGALGAGRFFERRLTMILRDRVSRHVSPRGLLAAGLLGLVALPSWTRAQSEAPKPEDERKVVVIRSDATADDKDVRSIRVVRDEELRTVTAAEPLEVRVFALTDDDDDKDDEKDTEKAKGKAERREVRVFTRREARDGDAPEKGDAKRDADDPERAEKIQKAREEVKKAQEQMKKAQEEMHAAIRKLQAKIQEETRDAQKQVAEQGKKLAEAQRKLAEAQGRDGRNFVYRAVPGQQRMTLRLDSKDVQVAPTPEGRTIVRRLAPPQEARPAGGSADVERRLDTLEKKFDKLLDEIKSLKRDR